MTRYLPGWKWGRTKPPRGALIDYGNPLATGLVFATCLNSGSGTFAEDSSYSGAHLNVVTGSPLWKGTPRGGGIFCTSSDNLSSASLVVPFLPLAASSYSIAAAITITANTSGGTVFTAMTNAALSLMKFNFPLAGVFQMTVNAGGGATQVSGTTAPVQNTEYSLVGTANRNAGVSTTGNALLYVNGVKEGTGNFTLSGIASKATAALAVSAESYISYFYAWSRVLSAADAVLLHGDPYSFWALPNHRRWFAGAVVPLSISASDQLTVIDVQVLAPLLAQSDKPGVTDSPLLAGAQPFTDSMSLGDVQAATGGPTALDLLTALDSLIQAAAALPVELPGIVETQAMAGSYTFGDAGVLSDIGTTTNSLPLSDQMTNADSWVTTGIPSPVDSLTSQDSQTFGGAASQTDAPGPVDTPSLQSTRPLADTLVPVDTAGDTGGVVPSDQLSASDTQTEAPVVSVSDTPAFTDPQALTAGVNVADALTATDSVIVLTGGNLLSVAVVDALTVLDAVTQAAAAAQADNPAPVDTQALTSSSPVLDLNKSADSPASAPNVAPTDSLTINDSRTQQSASSAADSPTVADLSAYIAGVGSAEAPVLLDAPTLLNGLKTTDLLSATDLVTALSTNTLLSVATIDALALSDAVAAMSTARSVDTAVFTDTTVLAAIAAVQDRLSPGEVIVAVLISPFLGNIVGYIGAAPGVTGALQSGVEATGQVPQTVSLTGKIGAGGSASGQLGAVIVITGTLKSQ